MKQIPNYLVRQPPDGLVHKARGATFNPACGQVLREKEVIDPAKLSEKEPTHRMCGRCAKMDVEELPPYELFVDLYREKKRADRYLAWVKRRIAEIEERVLDLMMEDAVESVRTSSGATVYIRQELWARVVASAEDGKTTPADREAACDALVDVDLDEFVYRTFNSQTMSKYFRDLKKEDEDAFEDMVDRLEGALDITEQNRARVRGA